MRKLKKNKELRAMETAKMSAVARADLLGRIVRNWDTGRTAKVMDCTSGSTAADRVYLLHESGRSTTGARHYFNYNWYLA